MQLKYIDIEYILLVNELQHLRSVSLACIYQMSSGRELTDRLPIINVPCHYILDLPDGISAVFDKIIIFSVRFG